MAERGARDVFRAECRRVEEQGQTLVVTSVRMNKSWLAMARTPEDLRNLPIYNEDEPYSRCDH
jgi:hypothetical protein